MTGSTKTIYNSC